MSAADASCRFVDLFRRNAGSLFMQMQTAKLLCSRHFTALHRASLKLHAICARLDLYMILYDVSLSYST